jgi:hypothetical protein
MDLTEKCLQGRCSLMQLRSQTQRPAKRKSQDSQLTQKIKDHKGNQSKSRQQSRSAHAPVLVSGRSKVTRTETAKHLQASLESPLSRFLAAIKRSLKEASATSESQTKSTSTFSPLISLVLQILRMSGAPLAGVLGCTLVVFPCLAIVKAVQQGFSIHQTLSMHAEAKCESADESPQKHLTVVSEATKEAKSNSDSDPASLAVLHSLPAEETMSVMEGVVESWAPRPRPVVEPVDSVQNLYPGLVVPPGSGGCILELPLMAAGTPLDSGRTFYANDVSGKSLVKVDITASAWSASLTPEPNQHPLMVLRAASLPGRHMPLLAYCKAHCAAESLKRSIRIYNARNAHFGCIEPEKDGAFIFTCNRKEGGQIRFEGSLLQDGLRATNLQETLLASTKYPVKDEEGTGISTRLFVSTGVDLCLILCCLTAINCMEVGHVDRSDEAV